MRISVHLLSQSLPIERDGVTNAYVKAGMYCLMLPDRVEKYPLVNIFRVVERDA